MDLDIAVQHLVVRGKALTLCCPEMGRNSHVRPVDPRGSQCVFSFLAEGAWLVFRLKSDGEHC